MKPAEDIITEGHIALDTVVGADLTYINNHMKKVMKPSSILDVLTSRDSDERRNTVQKLDEAIFWISADLRKLGVEEPEKAIDEAIKGCLKQDIADLTEGIVKWADEAFPDRQPSSAMLKLFEEIGELVRDPSNASEYADICIMLFDLANMHGVDLTQAICDKMLVNKSRRWKQTASGTMQHDEYDWRRAAFNAGKEAQASTGRRDHSGLNPEEIELYDRGFDFGVGEDVE